MTLHRSSLLAVLLLVTLLGVANRAGADPIVVTFDDLAGDNLQVPTGYGGIDWLNGWTHYGFDQEPYTAKSRPQRVYPTRGSQLPPGSEDSRGFVFMSPDQLFSGAWFAGFNTVPGLSNAPAWVYFKLYDDGALVHSSGMLTPTNRPGFLSGGYARRIDRVDVVSNNSGYWVMDNVTYGTTAAPTPEPATTLLVGSGLAALCLRKRRNS